MTGPAVRPQWGREGVGPRWGYPDEPNLAAMVWALTVGPLARVEYYRDTWSDDLLQRVVDQLRDREPVSIVDAEIAREMYWTASASAIFGVPLETGRCPYGILHTRDPDRSGSDPEPWLISDMLPHHAAAWPVWGSA